MSSSARLLWSPSETAETQMAHFAATVAADYGFEWKNDYHQLWQWSVDKPEEFWSALWEWHGIIGDKGTRMIENPGKMPGTKFFPDATLNYAENMLSFDDSLRDIPALIAHGEDGRRTVLSRVDLRDKALRLAGWMRARGVIKGDRVAGYVPNSEIALIAMLASASLGAIFSSCSPDFGITGVTDRFGQIEPKILISINGYHYNGKIIDKREVVAQLVDALPSIEAVLIDFYLDDYRDISMIRAASVFADALTHAPLDSFVRVGFNDPLFILYSSGTTGAPKCIVHSVGGTISQHVKEHRLHIDVRQGDRAFYFSTCGWMMWNWLVSCLMAGATAVVYEGSPFYPGPERLWEMAETEKLTLFGTSAKYLDAVRKEGIIPADIADLSALRTLCSTGSPLSEESFDFVYESIKSDVHLSSISGGTDLMACFVLGCPTLPVYAGEIQVRGLGMDVAILDDDGKIVAGEQGELCCLTPFPSMPVGFWKDDDGSRYHAAYFDMFDNIWRHGDWGTLTPRGGIIIHGRSDATLNPGGVRIGTAEIYRIVEAFDEIIEALVIGQSADNDVRIVLFVRLAQGCVLCDELQQRLRAAIRKDASPRHVPAVICTVTDIPRTRSGKITELAVRDVVHGRAVKNTEALSNPEALDQFKGRPELAT